MEANRSPFFKRALVSLWMLNTDGGADREQVKVEHPPADLHPDVEWMDAFDVLHLICKNDDFVVAGDPKRAFAHFDAATGVLHVYARSDQAVEIFTDTTMLMLTALECTLKDGASFSSAGREAVCVLEDITARGRTYGEAALRALAKRQLSA